jgi:hypothetical protein
MVGANVHPIVRKLGLSSEFTKGDHHCNSLVCIPGNVSPDLIGPLVLVLDVVAVCSFANLISDVLFIMVGDAVATRDDCCLH